MLLKDAKKIAAKRQGWFIQIEENQEGGFAKWFLFSKTGKYANAYGICPLSKIND